MGQCAPGRICAQTTLIGWLAVEAPPAVLLGPARTTHRDPPLALWVGSMVLHMGLLPFVLKKSHVTSLLAEVIVTHLEGKQICIEIGLVALETIILLGVMVMISYIWIAVLRKQNGFPVSVIMLLIGFIQPMGIIILRYNNQGFMGKRWQLTMNIEGSYYLYLWILNAAGVLGFQASNITKSNVWTFLILQYLQLGFQASTCSLRRVLRACRAMSPASPASSFQQQPASVSRSGSTCTAPAWER